MLRLPARDLRSNLATWAVPPAVAPAVAGVLLDTLPREAFDPGFFGHVINTHYFDTATSRADTTYQPCPASPTAAPVPDPVPFSPGGVKTAIPHGPASHSKRAKGGRTENVTNSLTSEIFCRYL
jgi:hypothetical protein